MYICVAALPMLPINIKTATKMPWNVQQPYYNPSPTTLFCGPLSCLAHDAIWWWFHFLNRLCGRGWTVAISGANSIRLLKQNRLTQRGILPLPLHPTYIPIPWCTNKFNRPTPMKVARGGDATLSILECSEINCNLNGLVRQLLHLKKRSIERDGEI